MHLLLREKLSGCVVALAAQMLLALSFQHRLSAPALNHFPFPLLVIASTSPALKLYYMPAANLINGHADSPSSPSPLSIIRGSSGFPGSSSISTSRRIAWDGPAVIAMAKTTLSKFKCEWRSCEKTLNCWASLKQASFRFFHCFPPLFCVSWVVSPALLCFACVSQSFPL